MPAATLQLPRRLAAEAIGSGLLLAAVVGSRIMGDRLSGGNHGIAFLVNTAATGAVVVALMFAFTPVSGAHLNPAVSFGALLRRKLTLKETAGYVGAQLLGGFAGVGATLLIFGPPTFSWSNPHRSTVAELTGELLATFGLTCVVAGCARLRSGVASFAVGAYLTSVYWFTESTSFANPAVAIAKGLTETSSSIRPTDVWTIVSVQLLGAALGGLLARWLFPGALGRRGPSRVVFASECAPLAQLAASLFAQQVDRRDAEALAATPFPEAGDAQLHGWLEALGVSPARALPLTDELYARADLLITLGLEDAWAALMEGERLHWEVSVPSDAEGMKALREVLRARVKLLARDLGMTRLRPVPLVRARAP
jgi:glycerol uptake facilitator-like aquaporin